MTSSFNAFGKSGKNYDDPSVPVWLGKVRAVPVGGSFASKYIVKGALYAAGTPVQLDGKTIKPCLVYEAVSLSTGTDDTLVIKQNGSGIMPAVNDYLMKVGATFATTGKAAKVKTVAINADGNIEITVNTGKFDTINAGDAIAFSSATAEAGSKSLEVIPNGYLYNDVYLGDIDVTNEMAGASGAVVMYHGEGILINRTPAAPVKTQMAAAVPHVLQVNY